MRNEGRLIFESECKTYRIMEYIDEYLDLEFLKGDSYNPEINKDIPELELKKQEKRFENLVNTEGVFGYALEHWDPKPNQGWQCVDSCWGFVGQYSPEDTSGIFNHYIVDELKEYIPTLKARAK